MPHLALCDGWLTAPEGGGSIFVQIYRGQSITCDINNFSLPVRGIFVQTYPGTVQAAPLSEFMQCNGTVWLR